MSENRQPDQGDEELQSLNADDLNVQELDDAVLEDAAGGTFEQQDDQAGFACEGYHCTNNVC
jgi:hypothetical protein